MFAWLTARRLRKQRSFLERLHLRLLEEARDLQRNGDIRGFADRTEEAEAVSRQLDQLPANTDQTPSPTTGRQPTDRA